MKKINISSTSYIFPQDESWKYLKKKFIIEFNEYGQLFNANKKENFYEIIFFFLPDIVDYFDLNNKSLKKYKIKINHFINRLNSTIKQNQKNYIIIFSEYLFDNQILFSKNQKYSIILKNYLLDRLNVLSKKYKNIFNFDLDYFFSKHGYNYTFSKRNFYLMNCRLSTQGINLLSKELNFFLKKINTANKKVLILDCDNTLWGGVLGEEGIEKIQIGQDGIGKAYQDFQKVVKYFKNQGILLVLASKNNEQDVKQVLKKHKSMILKDEDITSYKVNWEDKARNIIELSNELMLGLDSFVFWDDNPIEREKVRKKIKQVEVIEPKNDVSYWPTQLMEYKGFAKFTLSKEDKNKTTQYKQRNKFLEKKKLYKDEIKYLRSIKIKPKILKLNQSNTDRAVQLTQKTNQFNFTSKKYSHSELKKINSQNKIFLVELSDIYGDHGIISLVIIKKIQNIMYLDTFILSCRILGRYLENWLISKIQEYALKNKVKYTLINFIPTKKNDPAKNFINKLNLESTNLSNLNIKPKNMDSLLKLKKSKKYILSNNCKISMINIYD